MKTINIYGKEIPIREYGCKGMHYNKIFPYEEERVNLFIQVDGRCNANCPFCIYHNHEGKRFNIEKLAKIVSDLSTNFVIGKLNFTGGEPTIDLNKFNEVVYCTKENINWKKKPEVTLNTNGLYLMETLIHESYFDVLGLSRHHYDDRVNSEIFGCSNFASNEIIKEFQKKVSRKQLLQLRCNVIKGYIDNSNEVELYLNHAIDMGVYDCGFVTLFYANEYCKSHQIDFYNMLSGIENIIKVNGYERLENGKQMCECGNYVYTNNCGEFCKFYNRYFCNSDLIAGQLVYDGENLRFGFNGPIIY